MLHFQTTDERCYFAETFGPVTRPYGSSVKVPGVSEANVLTLTYTPEIETVS